MKELQNQAMAQFREIIDDMTSLSNSLPYADGLKVDAIFDKLIKYDELQEKRIRLAKQRKIEGV